MIEALGGPSNIGTVDNCITRLRIDITDNKKIDKDLLKKSGCAGVSSSRQPTYSHCFWTISRICPQCCG
ncbi:MAG: PTS transporter subunit EIIB [Eubacteriales bacterium]